MQSPTYTLYEYDWSSARDTFDSMGYKLLSLVDESEPYEVDQTAIYLTPQGKFAYASASGCSCWGGDWTVSDFDSLDEIEETFLKEDIHMYNPSMKGFRSLMAEAREAFDNSGQQAT